MNFNELAHFIDREEIITAFERLLSPEGTVWSMLVDGLAGTGKSVLVDWLQKFRCQGISSAKITLTQGSSEKEILSLIAHQISPEIGGSFDRQLAEESRQPVVQINQIQKMEASIKGLIKDANQNIAALNLDRSFAQLVKAEQSSRWLDMLVQALSSLQERPWVLFVNQTEYLVNPDLKDFLEHLISRIHTRFPKFRVYLTGQAVPRDWSILRERYSSSLTTFSLAQTKELLEKLGIEGDALQRSVFNATDGHPLLVSMLLEELLASGGNIDADLLKQPVGGFDEQTRTQWIYERIVNRFDPETILSKVVTNLALLEWFDLSLLRSLFGEEISESAFHELVSRSFVKEVHGHWHCHEIIGKHWRPRREREDPVQCRDIQKRAFEAIEARMLEEEERSGEHFFHDRLEYSVAALNSAMAFSASKAFDFARKEVTFAAAWGDADYLFGLAHYLRNSQPPEALRNLVENTENFLEVMNLRTPNQPALAFIEELAGVLQETGELAASDTLLVIGAWFSLFLKDLRRAREFARRAVSTHDTIENRAMLVDILANGSALDETRQATLLDEARQALAEARAAFGDSPELALAAADIALASDDRSAAIAQYVEIITDFPEACTEARLELANINLEDDEIDAALKQVQTVLEHDPQNPEALILRSNILISQGRVREGLAYMKDLAKHLPQLVEQITPLFGLLSDPLTRSNVLTDLTYEPESVPLGLFLGCMAFLAGQGDVEHVDQIGVQVEERWPETRDIVKAHKGLARSFAGRHAEAVQILEPLLKSPRPTVDASIGLARSFEESGQGQRAREVLQGLSDRMPALRDLIDQLMAQSLNKEQGPGAGLQYLQNGARTRNLGPLAQVALAECHASVGSSEDLEQAREILQRVRYTYGRETLPIDTLIRSRLLLADLLIKSDTSDEARGVALNLHEAFPDIPQAAIAAAQIFKWLGDEEKLRDMLRSEPSNSLVQIELMAHLAAIILDREPVLESLLAELERYPERMEVLLAIDLLLTSTGQLDRLVEFLPHIEEVAPGLLARYQQWQSQALQFMNPAFEDQLRKQKALTPDSISVRLALVRALQAAGKTAEALRELDELAAQHPELHDLRVEKSVEILLEARSLDEAETLLAPYMDLEHPPQRVANAIWALLDAKADEEQKFRFAERMKEHYPYFVDLGFDQAFKAWCQELLEKGKAQDLLKLIQSCLESSAMDAPQTPLIVNELLWKAKALKQLGRLQEALEVLQPLDQRQDLEPRHGVEICSLMGEVLRELQDLQGAEAAFSKGIEIDPWNAEPYLGLVQLFRKQERWGEAYEALKNALAVKPALVHEYEEELRTLKAHYRSPTLKIES